MASLRRLEVRLARTEEEIVLAQKLRYRVFYEELGAKPSLAVRRSGRDIDSLDENCDHLIVVDGAATDRSRRVVGTYRLNLGDPVPEAGRFYSSREYDLKPLLSWPERLLEVGRSCVAPEYRSGVVMQKLWCGIADYVDQHDVGVMFGCGSFPGIDPESHAYALSYLHHHCRVSPNLRAAALPERHIDMNLLPREDVDRAQALTGLPPLIKGYLRLGGGVGEGAVIDHQFNTVDVCIIVNARTIVSKYHRFYMAQRGEKKAA